MDEFEFEGIPRSGINEDEENMPPISRGNLSKFSTNFKSLNSQTTLNSSQSRNKSGREEIVYPKGCVSSSNISKQSTQKQLSSTLKSSHSGKLFQPDVSEIQNVLQKSNLSAINQSSTSIASKNNGLFDGFDMNDSTQTMAKNYLKDRNTQKPKQSEALRKPLTPANINPRSIEALVNFQSSLIHSSTPSTNAQQEIAIKPSPLSHFGFVGIGEAVQSKIFVLNRTSTVLAITPVFNNPNEIFRLLSHDTVYIESMCSGEFGIIFSPKEYTRYRKEIKFIVGTSGNQYSHILFGYGGTANIQITQRNRMTYFPHSRVYRCTPSDPTNFTFELENSGSRSSFVHISPLDDMENETRSITVEPESFCLYGKSNETSPSSKQKITVKVSDNYMQQISRSSLDSAGSSSSGSTTKSRLLTLKVYYGVERLRQRATRYSEEQNRHQTYRGLLLTKTPFFLNGKPVETVDRDPTSIQDIEMLKAQTRVLTIIVGDDRVGMSGALSLPSRPASSISQDSSQDGYYFPSKDIGNISMDSNVTNSDRTFY
uniref:Uncharacterized protein n=1 Tax=Panagrolaimus sp. PS1159 TaxID=55785 RepID=A0AC35FLD7_9BILA